MCRQDMGHLTPWATDSRQILWRRDGGNRRSTAPRVHARSLPENMAFRSDILSEARQNSAGDYEHTARAMSRHVMWHQLRAMREENRATLSGGPRRFIRQTTIASNNRGDMRCPRLQDLPEPPSGKRGWPWTEESTPLLGSPPNGRGWPRITVVTPSFNQARFLEETLRSVLLQGYPNTEYFVLDGGSTDGSIDIIKRYSSWIDYWTSEPDGGQSAAINRGLRMGSGQLATWINSDDLLCKDALVRQVSQIALLSEGAPTSDMVYVGICLIIDAPGNVLFSHRGRVHSLEDLVRIRTVWRSDGYIVQPEVLFPRKLALAVGGLDPENHYTMDYELWGKLFLAGAEIRYTDTPFGMFRKHSNQKTHDMLRQTRSLLDTAAKLVLQADLFPDHTKDAILQDLHAYGEAYEANYWPGTGRLARLGLPRGMVTGLRRLKALLLKVPFGATRE